MLQRTSEKRTLDNASCVEDCREVVETIIAEHWRGANVNASLEIDKHGIIRMRSEAMGGIHALQAFLTGLFGNCIAAMEAVRYMDIISDETGDCAEASIEQLVVAVRAYRHTLHGRRA